MSEKAANPSNTSQNASQSQLQVIPAIHKRKSRKPPELQHVVVAKALIGTTNNQIAKDLSIDRSTVKAILSAAEIQQHVEFGRSRCVRMIPTSVNVIEKRLEKGSETAALAILRGTQVLVNQPVTTNQTNIQANTWITMRQQKESETSCPVFDTQAIKVKTNSENEPQ